jgi:hypothetical protein
MNAFTVDRLVGLYSFMDTNRVSLQKDDVMGNFIGTSEPDTLRGTEFADLIQGLNGDDP